MRLSGVLAMAAVVGTSACTTDPGALSGGASGSASGGAASSTGAGGTMSSGSGAVPPQQASAVDLVVMVDNSLSMADKQQALAATVRDLVSRLVNPVCVDAKGVAITQPPSAADACPAGTTRELDPIVDMHIGVVTSSLGGHSSDACKESSLTDDDHGHLIARKSAKSTANDLPTYQGLGFLAWDPMQSLAPPGTSSEDDLEATFRSIVLGADQVGCGFESQLESWYRFLVDPAPYKSITHDAGGQVVVQGTDDALLQQRKDFLRPDSLVAIVMVSDENDCSTKEYGQFWWTNQEQPLGGYKPGGDPWFHLPPARSECAKDPNDACCLSCAVEQGSCPPDPACAKPTLDKDHDNINLRCWDQKRRFGFDALYPIDRYTQALSSPTIADRSGQVVPNPLFAGGRNASLVFVAGIVGVPWQDVARDPTDAKKGLKDPSTIAADGTWNDILGDPAAYVAPKDPLMIESITPRSGVNPATGAPLAPAGANTPNANPINGKEWDITAHDDLEYACIFRLPKPHVCDALLDPSCDCYSSASMGPTDSPICEGVTQVGAKAYPGLRELSLLKSLGARGVVGSICPAQLDDPSSLDFGYRPVVDALIQAVRPRLQKL